MDMIGCATAAAADNRCSGADKVSSPRSHESGCVTVYGFTVHELRHAGVGLEPERELRYRSHDPRNLDDLLDAPAAVRADKIGAFKQLRFASDWFDSDLLPKVISPIKKLRSWAFVLCFLCIGLSTQFKELFTFGFKPFWAFTIGVLVNVPLGYFLSTVVFSRFWSNISSLM